MRCCVLLAPVTVFVSGVTIITIIIIISIVMEFFWEVVVFGAVMLFYALMVSFVGGVILLRIMITGEPIL